MVFNSIGIEKQSTRNLSFWLARRYINKSNVIAFATRDHIEELEKLTKRQNFFNVVADPGTGKLRILTPIEAERLQGFDDDWTNTGMPNRMRFFCMGNALVVPMITRMAKVLDKIIDKER